MCSQIKSIGNLLLVWTERDILDSEAEFDMPGVESGIQINDDNHSER